jgi:hypothetical protein
VGGNVGRDVTVHPETARPVWMLAHFEYSLVNKLILNNYKVIKKNI